MSLVTAKDVSKTYMTGDIKIEAIKGLNFEIEPASLRWSYEQRFLSLTWNWRSHGYS